MFFCVWCGSGYGSGSGQNDRHTHTTNTVTTVTTAATPLLSLPCLFFQAFDLAYYGAIFFAKGAKVGEIID
jgi:hypothetical protein